MPERTYLRHAARSAAERGAAIWRRREATPLASGTDSPTPLPLALWAMEGQWTGQWKVMEGQWKVNGRPVEVRWKAVGRLPEGNDGASWVAAAQAFSPFVQMRRRHKVSLGQNDHNRGHLAERWRRRRSER